ncbi:MAG TPA: hypothetical protein VMU73_11270 [Gaiellaceae bacterium]|nr:hypothetical protein [Gaiellaceae bacterium]
MWNLHDHVLGTSTPLWALLLALTAKVGASLTVAAPGLALVFDGVSSFVLFALLLHLRRTPGEAAGAAIVFLTFPDIFATSLSGMESSLFVLLCLVALLATARQHFVLSGGVAGAALICRPEAVFLVVAVVFYEVARGIPWRKVCEGVLAGCVVAGAWVTVATIYYGSPIPQSVIAKSHLPSLYHLSTRNLVLTFVHGQYGGGLYARTWWSASALLSFGCLVELTRMAKGARHGSWRDREQLRLFVVFPSLYVAGLGAVAAFTWFPWYYAPIYPFWLSLGFLGLTHSVRTSLRRVGRIKLTGGAEAVVAVALIASFGAGLVLVKIPARKSTYWTQGYTRLAAAIPRVARGSTAADEIGALGWSLYPRQVDDLVGLVTKQAVGTSHRDFLLRDRPRFIALRSDEAATLLSLLTHDPQLSRLYRLRTSFRSPDGSAVAWDLFERR